MVRVMFLKVKTALSKSNLPDLDYALNPYVGCIHSCIYCYAREYTREKLISENWGSIVAVKENLIKVLAREVRRKPKGTVGISTITDPYQSLEGRYQLTRRALALLLMHGFRVSIQTKSDLVLRDMDLLTAYAEFIDVGLTVTTLDDEVGKLIEPHAPPPSRRAIAIKRMSEEGITTWIFLGPILPGINDKRDVIEGVVKLAAETGSTIYYDKLRIKKFMYRSGDDVLRNVISKARRVNWPSLYEEIERTCADYGVKCLPSFNEGKVVKLDRFLGYT